MFKSKVSALVLSALFISSFPVAASANFGSGAAVIAEKTNLIKSGVSGEKICFRDTDFKAALGVANFSELIIKSVPEESAGTLIYAGRRAAPKLKIKRRCVPSLVFIPASPDVREARFSFSLSGVGDGREFECILKFTNAKNSAPTIISSASSITLPRKSSGVYGTLEAHDPDGDDFEFIVADFPKYGTLKLEENGEFLYTPPAFGRKNDSFAYVVRDSFGNWSEVSRISAVYD